MQTTIRVPISSPAGLTQDPVKDVPTRRIDGVLTEWNDERGFGFADSAGEARIFVHIKFFRSRRRRPEAGDPIRFTLGVGRDGGPAAQDVELLVDEPVAMAPNPVPPAPSASRNSRDLIRLPLALLILSAATVAVSLARAPLWFGALYVGMGLASAMLYAFDKAYARRGTWRVRETSLHLADACFGIAGGLVAQHWLRHKTRKPAFRIITLMISLFHAILLLALLGGLLTLDGRFLAPG